MPDLSLRQPLLDEDRDDREKDRRSLKLRSSVPTGVSPAVTRSELSSVAALSLISAMVVILSGLVELDVDMSDSIPLDRALAKLLFSEDGVRAGL